MIRLMVNNTYHCVTCNNNLLYGYNEKGEALMRATANLRVQKHRANLRKKGLKPIQIWVPDTHRKGFAAECKRQSLLVEHFEQEQEMTDFILHAADLKGWEWEE